MDTRALAALEEAIEPYQHAGFVVASQSEGAITLVYPRPKFSYLLFFVLLLVWPFALIYLISFNNQRDRNVCLRVTSKGQIEESGYTLEMLRRERDRARRRLLRHSARQRPAPSCHAVRPIFNLAGVI